MLLFSRSVSSVLLSTKKGRREPASLARLLGQQFCAASWVSPGPLFAPDVHPEVLLLALEPVESVPPVPAPLLTLLPVEADTPALPVSPVPALFVLLPVVAEVPEFPPVLPPAPVPAAKVVAAVKATTPAARMVAIVFFEAMHYLLRFLSQ